MNPIIPTLIEPVLLDFVFQEIQTALAVGLPWLDNVYGKAEVKEKIIDKKKIIYPTAYAGAIEYLEMFPDDKLGNFSFFVVDDPNTAKVTGRKNSDLACKFSLIIWFDFRKVFPTDHEQRSVEHIKKQLLIVFRKGFTRSRVTTGNFYERGANVYKGFTISEISSQYNIRPYGSLRLECSMTYTENQPNLNC